MKTTLHFLVRHKFRKGRAITKNVHDLLFLLFKKIYSQAENHSGDLWKAPLYSASFVKVLFEAGFLLT